MLGVSCRAFRVMCARYGAGLVYTPMVNIESLAEKRQELLDDYVDIAKDERPTSLQLVGNNQDKLKQSIELIKDYADIIDINFGCPDSDILGNKSGAFFIKHPEQLSKFINSAVDAANTKPITAKIRIGWDDNNINAIENSKIIEDAGAAAIAVHGRTRKQAYTGKANWNVIKQVKDKINIPVIGNGDVSSPELAKQMFDKTGCDFVMIGRGAIGKPFLFEQCNDFLEKGTYKNYNNINQRYDLFKEFLKEYDKQNRQKFSEIRQHAMWFTKGMKGSKQAKQNIMKMDAIDEIKEYFESLE